MLALVYDNPTAVRWMLCKAAGAISKRAFAGPLSPLRLKDIAIPALPGRGWVRLRTLLGGVCGTDLALVAQRNHPATILQRFAAFPAVLGHENVAVIDEVGSGVSAWRVGQRVCVEPALGCAGRGVEPPCGQCAAGRTSMCEHIGDASLPPRALIGLNQRTGGSWAEYFVAHESQLHAVPEGVSDDAAVLVDPVASAAHAVMRRAPREGERVLVQGSGIIALGVIAAIRALGHGHAITAVVRHRYQAELARTMGAGEVVLMPRRTGAAEKYDKIAALVGGRRVAGRFGSQGLIGGFELTYDCTGTGRGLTDAMMWTRSRGTVVAVGTSGISVVDTTPLWFDELEIVGANGRQVETGDGGQRHTYDMVFDWLTGGRMNLSAVPVTRYRLSDFRTAFDHLLNRGRHPIIKAAFEPGGP